LGDSSKVGIVESVEGDYARVSGLSGAMAGELLALPDGGAGVVARLEREQVLVERLDARSPLGPGDIVRCSGRLPEIAVGAAVRGRVVDALGRPLDGAGPITAQLKRRLRSPAPGLAERAASKEMLWTGVKQLDLFCAIARGERVLLAGGPRTGKSTLALDAVLGQRATGVTCVIAPLRDPPPELVPLRATLEAAPGLDWTVVAGGGVLAPFAAVAIAEQARSEGRSALVVLDDLEFHAYRWTRRAYPLSGGADEEGHRFALANLLSRAGVTRAGVTRGGVAGGGVTGGGSVTIIATANAEQAGLVLDLRSVTDACIFFDEARARAGEYPAIDLPRSLRSQHRPPLRGWGKSLHLALLQSRELWAHAARVGRERLDRGTRKQLEAGERLAAILRQPPGSPIPIEEQVASVYGALSFDGTAPSEVPRRALELIEFLIARHPDLLAEIRRRGGVDRARFDLALQELAAR
jgi:F-type H+-transporting ATPase subunit alpha